MFGNPPVRSAWGPATSRSIEVALVCVVSFLNPALAFSSGQDPREVALNVLDEIFIVYRDSHFHFATSKQKQLTEILFRPEEIIIDPEQIEPADELNGTEWKGYLDIPYASRELFGVPPLDPDGRWGCWSEGVFRIRLQQTNGSWSWSLVRSEFTWWNSAKSFEGNLADYLRLDSQYCGLERKVGGK